jgi:hypothetical protein
MKPDLGKVAREERKDCWEAMEKEYDNMIYTDSENVVVGKEVLLAEKDVISRLKVYSKEFSDADIVSQSVNCHAHEDDNVKLVVEKEVESVKIVDGWKSNSKMGNDRIFTSEAVNK